MLERLLEKIRRNPSTSIYVLSRRESYIYIYIYLLNEEHSATDALLRWRGGILLVKPSKGLIRSTFNKAAKKQHNLFGLLHSTFNFLLSLICSCRHLSIFNPLPSLLSLKGTFTETLSRTSSHTRPDYNRPTYLPGSFIYLLPPPSLPPGFGLIIDMHGDSCLRSISIANEKDEKEVELFLFFGGWSHRPAVCGESDQLPGHRLPERCGLWGSQPRDTQTATWLARRCAGGLWYNGGFARTEMLMILAYVSN